MDRDMLINVARTSLRTKVHPELADVLTEVGQVICPFTVLSVCLPAQYGINIVACAVWCNTSTNFWLNTLNTND